MSLLLAYHDRTKAIIASDDRATNFDKQPLDMRVPKFQILDGDLILGAVGRADVLSKLHTGTSRLVSQRKPRVLELAASLPHILRKLHAERTRLDISDWDDRLHVLLLGYDPAQGRIRCFVWQSDNDFQQIETTADPNNRVVCLGAFDLAKESAALNSLTRRLAKPKALPFVASQLRDTVNDLSEKYPAQIGRASYFAGIDARGTVELPEEFASPEVMEEAIQ